MISSIWIVSAAGIPIPPRPHFAPCWRPSSARSPNRVTFDTDFGEMGAEFDPPVRLAARSTSSSKATTSRASAPRARRASHSGPTATSMYILPGFVDAHVHAGSKPKNEEAEYAYKLWPHVVRAREEADRVRAGLLAGLVIVPENPLQNFKTLYGHRALYLNEKTGKEDWKGGVKYTIRDGIVCDAKKLLADVAAMVEKQKKSRAGRKPRPRSRPSRVVPGREPRRGAAPDRHFRRRGQRQHRGRQAWPGSPICASRRRGSHSSLWILFWRPASGPRIRR